MVALQQQEQPAVNNKALLWTIGVHALLFLLFMFLRYSITPAPPVTDVGGGMEVNLGTSDDGSGHNQPMNTKAPAPYQATVVYKSAAVQSSLPKDIVQSNEADAPEVNNSKKNKPTPKAEVTPTVEKPKAAPPKPKYTYAGGNGLGGNSAVQNMPGTSEGNGKGQGDKGVPGGAPGAPNYSGIPGNGTGGIGHTLSGRSISPDHFEAEFNEAGRVKVHVTVDKNGTITSKQVVSFTSAALRSLALEKLNNAHFSKSEMPEQAGDVTINFTTRK